MHARRAGFLIGGISLALLCGAPRPASAQSNGAPGVTLTARTDSPTLPDVALPVAAAGSALERAATQSSNASPSAQSPGQDSQSPAQGSPNPPGAPSLGDLGLTPEDTEGSAARQALMDRRTHMLKLHQRLGLITVIPVAAACISAVGAPPEHGNYGNTARYSHVLFHQAIEGAAHHITGVVPATLTDFKIEAPTFLTIPIKNDIPIRVDMVWQPA